MENSILSTIKDKLGIENEYTKFDGDIITQINTSFSVLNQLGAGPSDGFRIHGYIETWCDYLEDSKKLDLIKDFIYLRVRKIFDPPTSSSVLQAIESEIKELEWRINVAVDPGEQQ